MLCFYRHSGDKKPRWRNWQTRGLEGAMEILLRPGSNPGLGIKKLASEANFFIESQKCSFIIPILLLIF